MSETTFFFLAEIVKIQTLSDQGLRVTLDLSEDEIAAAAKLMECKRAGVTIRVMVELGETVVPAERRIERDPRARSSEKLK
jgi:hypothetical protein